MKGPKNDHLAQSQIPTEIDNIHLSKLFFSRERRINHEKTMFIF